MVMMMMMMMMVVVVVVVVVVVAAAAEREPGVVVVRDAAGSVVRQRVVLVGAGRRARAPRRARQNDARDGRCADTRRAARRGCARCWRWGASRARSLARSRCTERPGDSIRASTWRPRNFSSTLCTAASNGSRASRSVGRPPALGACE